MSQPVIIKNKIVYGYMDKATVCRDMGREDYNDLTEAQQLNGDVCFIQGVDASAFAPTNSLWNKVGTTPLDSDLPADCSNAINQLKSNLTELEEYSLSEQLIGKWVNGENLYRKVIAIADSSAGNIVKAIPTTDMPTSYVVRMAKLYISYKLGGTGQEYRRIGQYVSYYYDGTHNFKLDIGSAIISYTIIAVMEYTK